MVGVPPPPTAEFALYYLKITLKYLRKKRKQKKEIAKSTLWWQVQTKAFVFHFTRGSGEQRSHRARSRAMSTRRGARAVSRAAGGTRAVTGAARPGQAQQFLTYIPRCGTNPPRSSGARRGERPPRRQGCVQGWGKRAGPSEDGGCGWRRR